ncbi:response regulator [Alkalimonas amylolytica]|uniref:Response regulator receiver domain-containing protein n=1 Tax=Alkalimonas amylolytica TaxID=152573 RepID=A0A1H3ZHE7_ALKAM|nr:response regulator [Alkalimonas amylolytica]SEA23077.1 Response regulator receiver domain-containing protein [Alkalimonas amylolytica]
MLQRSYTILVVDDVTLMCDFLYGAVNRIPNCSALKALDGKTALELLEESTVDMLITDLEIKAPDGLELIKRIRAGKLPTAHDIPILIFSGNAYLAQVQQSIAYDVNDFLVKPLSFDALGKKVLHHLTHEKFIQPAHHYAHLYQKELDQPKEPPKEPSRKVSASIVRQAPPQEETGYLPAADDETTLQKEKDFLNWPEDSTTGIYQLDRRLKKFAFNLSCFHNVFVKDCKLVAMEAERKRTCEAIDYLNYVVKNLQKREGRPEFWHQFKVQLIKLNKLGQQLEQADLRHNSLVLDLLKRFSYWWMQTINRPLVQKLTTTVEKLHD